MINKATKELIADWEGLKLKPYLCEAGVPTIGIGSTCYADGTKVKLSDKPITEEEAWDLFYLTLNKYVAAVEKYVTVKLTDNQFGALVSFAYNVGINGFKASTLLKRINRGEFDIGNEFAKWNKVKGKPSRGLTNRRTAEWKLFNT